MIQDKIQDGARLSRDTSTEGHYLTFRWIYYTNSFNMKLSSENKDRGCIWTTILVYLCIVTWVIGNFMLSPSLSLKSSSKKEKFRYNLYELQLIRGKISTYRKHGLLPRSTVARIRSLQIQRRRKRGRRDDVSKDTKLHSNGLDQKVNKGNLIQIVPSFHIIQKQNMWLK